MSDSTVDGEPWTLEVALSLVIGLPWYAFSQSLLASFLIHAGLAVLFLSIELGLFGRGSAIMSFLLVLIFSILFGLIAIGMNGGRLFGLTN